MNKQTLITIALAAILAFIGGKHLIDGMYETKRLQQVEADQALARVRALTNQ